MGREERAAYIVEKTSQNSVNKGMTTGDPQTVRDTMRRSSEKSVKHKWRSIYGGLVMVVLWGGVGSLDMYPTANVT